MTKNSIIRKTGIKGRPRLSPETRKEQFPLRLVPAQAKKWRTKAQLYGVSNSELASIMLDLC